MALSGRDGASAAKQSRSGCELVAGLVGQQPLPSPVEAVTGAANG